MACWILLAVAVNLCGAKREGLAAGSGGSRRAAIDASGVLSAVNDSPARRSTSHGIFEEPDADVRPPGVALFESDVHVAKAELATQEAFADAEERSENYPMYVCNSICAQCANGEAVFIRRAMTWKHFAVRAAFEVTVGSLSTVTAVTGAGTIVSYGLTAASEAAARRAGLMSLPNECKAISALRTSNDTSLNKTLTVNIAQLDEAAIKEHPDLSLYMKNMKVIAQKEKDRASNGSVGWRDWGKRIAGFERLYEEPGMVPETIEELTAQYFCSGDKGGLMRLDDDLENSTVDNQTEDKSGTRGVRYVIQQESNWRAFARSTGSLGGVKGNQRKRLQAVGMCHAAAAKAHLEASWEEQTEDEEAAEAWEESHRGNESDLEKELDKHENEVLQGIVDSSKGLSSWKVVYQKGVRVRTDPSLDANVTGGVLRADEIFFVDEVKSSGESNMLHLADGQGWVFDKKGSKTVSVPLESNTSIAADLPAKASTAEASPEPFAAQPAEPASTSFTPRPSEGPEEMQNGAAFRDDAAAEQVPVQKLELSARHLEQDDQEKQDSGSVNDSKKRMIRSEKSAARNQVASLLLVFFAVLPLTCRS